jgi:hypothetical protein
VIDPNQALAGLPEGLRQELLDELNGIVRNYRERRWEPAELDGGKLCEVVYSILRGHVDGAFPDHASKPANMVDACKELEGATGFPRTVRIQIPRMLVAMYEIRNNRNVGHVGGDVSPSHMDATVIVGMAKWVIAELVRLFHSTDTRTATVVVDALIERQVPLVWEVGDRRRILDPRLSRRDQALLLLYSSTEPVHVATLAGWIEYERRYLARDVVRPLHAARLVDFEADSGLVHLSPTGIDDIEARLLRRVAV